MTTRVRELWLLGVDFSTAPVAVREWLSYTPDAARSLLRSATGIAGLREAVIVSTCNRTEFYLVADPGADAVSDWVAHVRQDRPDAPIGDQHCVLSRAHGQDAICHLLRVSCGLESSILGDVHIGGQLKKAVALAGEAGTLGPVLSRAFQHAFRVMKTARSETEIGRGHASLGSAVAGLIQARGGNQPRVLILGSGTAARDIGRQLAKWGIGQLTVINRTHRAAAELARQLGAEAAPWETLDHALETTDVLVAATSAKQAVVGHAALARAVAQRAGRPFLVVDIGVPRNVEAVDGVASVSIDDISARRDEALVRRQGSIPDVEALIARELARWERWLWARPGEELLERMFAEEWRRRTELVHALVGAGFPGDPNDLNQLIGRSWKALLRGHARGLRQWLNADDLPLATGQRGRVARPECRRSRTHA
jgi:glutamyl-tRNA reductase